MGHLPGSGNQRIREMVERASEIVDSIPEHESQLVWDSADRLSVIDKLLRLKVMVFPDGVWLGIPKGIGSGLELIDAYLGPLVFC